MLRVRRVTGVRVYDELRIRKMLNEQERVDRHDDNVLVSMGDECGMAYLMQHGKTVGVRNRAPLPQSRYLGAG